jgi:hypothetical protein
MQSGKVFLISAILLFVGSDTRFGQGTVPRPTVKIKNFADLNEKERV